MIRRTQTVIIAALTLVLLIVLPSLLLWGVIAYTQAQTRVGLIEGLGLAENTTYTEAIAYFDCQYLYAGMTRTEFEERLAAIGDYKVIPESGLALQNTTVSIDFPRFNLSRQYAISPDTITQVRKSSFGAAIEQVVCPS